MIREAILDSSDSEGDMSECKNRVIPGVVMVVSGLKRKQHRRAGELSLASCLAGVDPLLDQVTLRSCIGLFPSHHVCG